MKNDKASDVSVALRAVAKRALANSSQRYTVESRNDGAMRRVDSCSPGKHVSTQTAARLVEPTPHANGRRSLHRAPQGFELRGAVAFERYATPKRMVN